MYRRRASVGKVVTLRAPLLISEGREGVQVVAPISESRNIQGVVEDLGYLLSVTSAIGSSPKVLVIVVYHDDAYEIAQALSRVGYTAIFSA